MPRLTRRVFRDLAIWMAAFGLAIGLVFPPFCVLLGLPADRVLAPYFFAATLAAGLLVGLVNWGLAKLVVGRRLRVLADRMNAVEGRLAEAAFTHDWSACDPATCALEVDSDDEVGDAAVAFNRLIETLARSHAVEASMRRFSEVLSSRFELDALGDAALDALLRHTGAQAGAILVVRDDALDPLASLGMRDVAAVGASDHVRRALRTGRIERLTTDPDAVIVDSLLVGQVPREILLASISFKSVPLGVLVLATPAHFDPDTTPLLEQFRADLGLAINNALAHDRLERLAAVDPLTDAYNRRFGLGRLHEEFGRAVRAEAPLGALMFDIDRFKAVNDTYGHLVGDRVLKTVARAARRVVREGDVLVRYGGEEFLVILPGAGAADIRQVGERIRRAVAESEVVDGAQTIRVTVSLGGATYRDALPSAEALVAAADGALYDAKEAGRDRLVTV